MKKNKKVIVLFNNVKTFLPVMTLLQKEHAMDPVFWSAPLKYKEIIESAFGKIGYYDPLIHGLNNIPSNMLGGEKSNQYLTPELIKHFSYYEHVFMEMLHTRCDPGGGFSFYESQQVFYQHISQAFSLLKRYQADALLLENTPHMMWDYILYVVAKYLNLSIVMFSDTPVPGRMVVYKDLEDGVPQYKKNNESDDLEVSGDIYKYVESLKGGFADGTTYMIKSRLPAAGKESHWSSSKIKSRLKNQRDKTKKILRRAFLNKLLGRKEDVSKKHYLKQFGKSWGSSFVNAESFYQQRLKDSYKRKLLFDCYDRLAKKPNLNVPYVYFPLHWQPENTTVPMAGVFSNQHLALSLLREAIPHSWKIYIKENPGQFEWHRGSFARYPTYYKDMLAIDNVELIKMDSDPFDLIDSSQCVLTVTGTTGWEAIVRGKAALVMGNCVWYVGAPNFFRVSSVKDIKCSVEKICKRPSRDLNDELDVFMREILKRTYTCVINATHIDSLVGNETENINELARAVIDNI